MEWTPEIVFGGLALVLGGAGGGGWVISRRNGHAKHNGCPSPLQRAHGERLATLETLARTQGREIGEIKGDVKTILERLPKP